MTRQDLILQNTKLQNECQRLFKCGQAAAQMNAVYANIIKQLLQKLGGTATLPYENVKAELVLSDKPSDKMITVSIQTE